MDHLTKLQRDFINLRFGTFIHFNSSTFQFHASPVVDWEYDHENGDEPRRFPFDEKGFAPDALDCRQWARIARSAGCRFAALTTKHHEGFALWPTAYSEHSVKNSARPRDIVAEYLEAFRAEGIAAGLYFSILDLTAEIGRRSCTDAQKAYIKGQITELLTNYGPIPFLIVDGWGAFWGGPRFDVLPFEEIRSLVSQLQPDCLLMNIGSSEDLSTTDVVFFENSAGQEADDSFRGPGISCQKLTGSWFWRDEDPDTATAKTEWVLDMAKRYFPMNVNLILNLSPNVHGLVDDNLAAAFADIGSKLTLPEPIETLPEQWLKRP